MFTLLVSMQVPSSGELARKTATMDVDLYPTASRIEVWWPSDNEWYTATVLKTRTMPHSVNGAKILCREIYCDYDLDAHMEWHALHKNDVRTCATPPPVEELSDVTDPFPVGERVEVWWPGDGRWYIASVLKTRTASHRIHRVQRLCREIYCDYDLDANMQWHSLHNNRIRVANNAGSHLSDIKPCCLSVLQLSWYFHGTFCACFLFCQRACFLFCQPFLLPLERIVLHICQISRSLGVHTTCKTTN